MGVLDPDFQIPVLDLVLRGEGMLGWTSPSSTAGEGPLHKPEKLPSMQAQT